MRKKSILTLSAFIFCLVFLNCYVSAQDDTYAPVTKTETQEGRYVLVTLNKSAYGSGGGSYGRMIQRRMPAVVLDSYLGVVWRCQDIKDDKPLWIKADLAKNSEEQLTRKKYVLNIPPYSGEDSKIPAIVLDTESGQTWTITDLTSESATWVKTDLPKEIKKEGYTSRY